MVGGTAKNWFEKHKNWFETDKNWLEENKNRSVRIRIGFGTNTNCFGTSFV